MTTIPVTVVGAGIIGETHADAVLRHPRLRVAAVVDPDEVARDALAARVVAAGGPAPERFAGLAGAATPGGLVTVCAPSGLHVALAEEALALGAHVLVEKPLDASPRVARRLADRTDEVAAQGLVTSVVCQHRFDPASVAVAAAAHGGGLGRLTSAVATVPWWRAQAYYDLADWRGTAPVERAADAVPVGELRGAPKPADSFVLGHLRQYDDVVAAIDGGRPPRVGLRDGLLSVAVVHAVYASAALGRPVLVDDVLRGSLDDLAEVS